MKSKGNRYALVGGGYSSEMEHWPGIFEALVLNLSLQKREEKLCQQSTTK